MRPILVNMERVMMTSMVTTASVTADGPEQIATVVSQVESIYCTSDSSLAEFSNFMSSFGRRATKAVNIRIENEI